MAVTSITSTITFQADLRDTNGNSIIAARITGIDGTYDEGGFVFDPAWFGLEEIEFLFIQGNIPFPMDDGSNIMIAQYAVKTYTDENNNNVWKLLVFVKDMGGEVYQYAELTDGVAMSINEATQLVVCVIGH